MQSAVFAVESVIVRDLGKVATAFGANVKVATALGNRCLQDDLEFSRFLSNLLFFDLFRQSETRSAIEIAVDS